MWFLRKQVLGKDENLFTLSNDNDNNKANACRKCLSSVTIAHTFIRKQYLSVTTNVS